MKKHFMCTHTFHSEESKSAFDAAAQNMTGAQMFAMMKNERAELIGHWRGDNEFFYCHWYADERNQLLPTKCPLVKRCGDHLLLKIVRS